jgi:hypothetical protein
MTSRRFIASTCRGNPVTTVGSQTVAEFEGDVQVANVHPARVARNWYTCDMRKTGEPLRENLVDEYGPTGVRIERRPRRRELSPLTVIAHRKFIGSLEVGKSRTPQELHHLTLRVENWVKNSHRGSLDGEDWFWKKYYEEVRPLALFLKPLISLPGVVCQPALSDTSNYDATVYLSEHRRFFIEITSSKNGYEDALRREVLRENGYVSLTGNVVADGDYIFVAHATKMRRTTLDEMRDALIASVRRKVSKNYGPRHILVVTFDDSFIASEDIEWFRSEVESEVRKSVSPFVGIYLLGLLNGTCCVVRRAIELDS